MEEPVSAEEAAWRNGWAAGRAHERDAITTWIKNVYGVGIPTRYMNPSLVIRALERGDHDRSNT